MSRYILMLTVVFLGAASFLMLVDANSPEKTNAASPQTGESGSGDSMRAFLESRLAEGLELTFAFVEPIAPGQDSRAVNSVSDMYAGDDYVCFVEAWNNDLRHRCTPMSNIASVTFIERR